MVTVLYHDDADGFGAAFAFWKKFGNDAKYIPVQYNRPVPEIPEGTQFLYIVDFSYERAILETLAEAFNLTVLDHHEQAELELAHLPYAYFDKTKSGCVMAWEHLYGGDDVPDILRYVQDRDLWKFELPDSRAVNLYVSMMAQNFILWDNFDMSEALTSGYAAYNFRQRQIDHAVRGATLKQLLGYAVPVINCTNNISEVGEALIEKFPESPFVAMYFDREDGKRVFSLRSSGFDVGALAKSVGGGGHKCAAGFSIDIPYMGFSALK